MSKKISDMFHEFKKELSLQFLNYKLNYIRNQNREKIINWLEQNFDENDEGEIRIESNNFNIFLGRKYRGRDKRLLRIDLKCSKCHKIVKNLFCEICNSTIDLHIEILTEIIDLQIKII